MKRLLQPCLEVLEPRACFNSVASTSRRSAGVTALNSAERSRTTCFAKGLPLAYWLPGANFPLPLDAVGDGESFMLVVIRRESRSDAYCAPITVLSRTGSRPIASV